MVEVISKYLDLLFKSKRQTPQQQMELVRDISRRGLLKHITNIISMGVIANTCCSTTLEYSKFLPDLGDADRGILSSADAAFFGRQVVNSIAQAGDMLDDYDTLYYLNSIGSELVSYSSLFNNNYFNFYALKGNEINAFALPGGFICVYNGLIYTTQSESELASVMAHEISHIIQHHVFRNIALYDRNQWLSLAGIIAGALLAPFNPGIAVAVASGGQGVAMQTILSFSRDFEREADRVGQDIMYNAGFDAHAMPSFFAKLQNSEKFNNNDALAFLRTHPVTLERISEAELRANQLPVKMRPDSLFYLLIKEKSRVRKLGFIAAINFYQQSIKNKRYFKIDIIYYGLAFAYYSHSHPQNALLYLNKIHDTSLKKHPVYYSLKGVIYAVLKEYKKADMVYQEALVLFSEYKSLWVGRVDLMIGTKDYINASKYLLTLSEQYPNDMDIWSRMASVYSDTKLNNQKLYFYALANQQLLLGNHKSALNNFEQSLKKTTTDKNDYFNDIISSNIIDIQALIKNHARYGSY